MNQLRSADVTKIGFTGINNAIQFVKQYKIRKSKTETLKQYLQRIKTKRIAVTKENKELQRLSGMVNAIKHSNPPRKYVKRVTINDIPQYYTRSTINDIPQQHYYKRATINDNQTDKLISTRYGTDIGNRMIRYNGMFAEFPFDKYIYRYTLTFKGFWHIEVDDPTAVKDKDTSGFIEGMLLNTIPMYYTKEITSMFEVEMLTSVDDQISSFAYNYLWFNGGVMLTRNVIPRGIIENLRRHNRSQVGQGDAYHEIEQYDDEHIYIPTSGSCFLKCVLYLSKQEDREKIEEKYKKYAVQNRLKSDKFPKSSISAFCTKIDMKIGIYDPNKCMVRNCKDYKHVIGLVNNHYVVLKKEYKKAFKKGEERVQRKPKIINNNVLRETEMCSIYENKKEMNNIFENTYVWDIESARMEDGHKQQPYACAYAKVWDCGIVCARNYRESTVNEILKQIVVKTGLKCISDMVSEIVAKEKKYFPKGVKNKKIYLYAHNGARFDNYLTLIDKNLKLDRLIKTARGLSRLYYKYEVSEKQSIEIIFCDSGNFADGSLKNLCTSYKLPQHVSKSHIEHHDITLCNFEDKKPIWEPYLKLDVLSLGIILAQIIKSNLDVTSVHINNCVSGSTLTWKGFIKLQYDKWRCENNKWKSGDDDDENDIEDVEPESDVHYFKSPVVNDFLRKSIYGGRVACCCNNFSIQGFEEIKNTVFQMLKVNNMDEMISYIDMFKSACRNKWEEKGDYITKSYEYYYNERFKIKHPELCEYMKKNIQGKELLYAVDGNSLYPSAMALYNQWPRGDKFVEFKSENENEIIEQLNNQKFYPKIGYFTVDIEIPDDNKFVVCAYRTKENGNVFVTGKLTQTYCSVDIEELVRCNNAKVLKIHEGMICEENYTDPIFKKYILKLNKLRNDFKKNGNEAGQLSAKRNMNSLYGKTIQKLIKDSWKVMEKKSLLREFDNRFKDIKEINGKFLCKIENDIESIPSMPLYLGSLILAYSRKIMNNLIESIDGFKNNEVYYTDTDSIYIRSSKYKNLIDSNYIGKELGQAKNDYGEGGIIHGIFLGNKVKFCLTVTETGVLDTHYTFKGCDGKGKLTYKSFEQMMRGEQLEFEFFRWKREMENGVAVYDSEDEDADNFKSTKKFDSNVNFRKRHKPDTQGWMNVKNIEELLGI